MCGLDNDVAIQLRWKATTTTLIFANGQGESCKSIIMIAFNENIPFIKGDNNFSIANNPLARTLWRPENSSSFS